MMEARTNGASARSGGFAARAASATAPRFARREGASGATSASSAPSASAAATGPAPADPLRFAKGPQDVRRAKRLALVAALSAAVAVIAVGYGAWAVVSASAQVGAMESDLAPTLVATTGIAAGDAVSPDQLEAPSMRMRSKRWSEDGRRATSPLARRSCRALWPGRREATIWPPRLGPAWRRFRCRWTRRRASPAR